MKRSLFVLATVVCFVPVVLSAQEYHVGDYNNGIDWKKPLVVKPADKPCAPPSDAIILFDGKNLDAWNGGPWDIANNELTVKPKSGDIRTKQKFGSCQLHLEFATPAAHGEKGQARGNSGLFFMDHYELQILDSFESETYYDGQCGSLYKQFPPYVNVCKAPGQWQTYDVIFTRPILRIENDKVVEVIRPAYITAFQNGVVVQNHYALQGDTYWHRSPEYLPHGDKESIRLQDHGNKMKFRNIWIREIPDSNIIPPASRLPHYVGETPKPAEAPKAK